MYCVFIGRFFLSTCARALSVRCLFMSSKVQKRSEGYGEGGGESQEPTSLTPFSLVIFRHSFVKLFVDRNIILIV